MTYMKNAMKSLGLGLVTVILFGGERAISQEILENPVCELKGENGMVTLLLCPEGLDQLAMASEGKTACGARMPCGAWIWVDAANVPEEAPDSHDKLTQDQVTSAKAIWVNETSKLVVLDQVKP